MLCVRSSLFEHIVNLLKLVHLHGGVAEEGNSADGGLAHLAVTEVVL